MNEKGQNTFINPNEDIAAVDRETTVPTPHFDALAVKKARPAVPLSQVRPGRRWPTGMLISIAIVAGLVGGIIGGLLPKFYRTDEAKQTETAQRSEPGDEGIDQSPAEPPTTPPTTSPTTPPTTPPTTSVTDQPGPGKKPSYAAPGERAAKPSGDTEATLRGALRSWVAATNARDLERQMHFYNPVVEAFYRSRNTPRSLVRAEKARVYSRATSVDINTDDPDVRLGADGRTAVMRFRKRYAIVGSGEDRRGEVLQELRWRLTDGQWRITSERDLRVIH